MYKKKQLPYKNQTIAIDNDGNLGSIYIISSILTHLKSVSEPNIIDLYYSGDDDIKKKY